MVAQQVARGEDQIIEVELGARALVVAIALQDRTRLLDQRRQNLAGRGLKKRSPGVTAGGVVAICGDVQPLPVGLREARLLRRLRPFALLTIGGEGACLCAKVRVRTRGEKPDQTRRRRRIGTGRQRGCHLDQPLDDHDRFRLGRRRPAHEGREIRRRLPEGRQMTVKQGGGRSRESAAAAQILGDLVDERHGFTGAVQHHFGEDAALVAGQALAQPAIDDLKEGEIGLIAVHDPGAGIDVGFGRIGLDQTLAEAVNGRAGDFVDRGACGREIATLRLRQAIGQRHTQLGRDMSGREVGDKLADTREKLAGRQFGEGDGGDGARRDTLGEHDGDASGHNGGLARARAGFDQDRAIMEADRVAPCPVILENFGHAAHHSASQI